MKTQLRKHIPSTLKNEPVYRVYQLVLVNALFQNLIDLGKILLQSILVRKTQTES
jgi:hypothetical protein